MAKRSIKLTIRYDGSSYSGWQMQLGRKTIQATISEAIEQLIGCRVTVFGASRTDAGVSALGQVGLIRIDSPIPTASLAKAITDRLPADIAVTHAEQLPDDFDITGAVKSKLYRYTIYTGKYRPVLEIRHCWYLPAELDIKAMDKAAGLLVGKKDFKSFASAADTRKNSVRTIFVCTVKAESDRIYIDVEGDKFLYNMVRNIVGTLTEVGFGRKQPEDIKKILTAKDRNAAGRLAPAAGLCLMWIKY